MPASKRYQDIEAMLNAKAWKDPNFRKLLVEDPKSALTEMGLDVKNMNVRVVEDDKTSVTFVIHPTPERLSGMGDVELMKIVGSGGSVCGSACSSYVNSLCY